ncbi:MAG: UDP-glucose 4-epimerase GalE [Aestuariibacter sp.]|nr:UDP-glucose 4-epimerase GalE [Aestuariibacter sp.]
MKILVAGGAGFIGLHTCVALAEASHEIVIVDSLINSRQSNIDNLQKIIKKQVDFVKSDVRDKAAMSQVFERNKIDAVINFAGHKAVGESVENPLKYYSNNLDCALVLLECMDMFNVKTMVFSSSAAVYGSPEQLPISETARISPQSPYGRTKQFIEEILCDLFAADPAWRIANLRYFNPVGSHSSGLIGELPVGDPENLVPYIAQVAAGMRSKLRIFGDDYDTPDGTGIRDYIHVMDLAQGHVKALAKLDEAEAGRILTVNLGTGKGYSVLELVDTFARVSGQVIPREIASRRVGDVPACYADPSLAVSEIGWVAQYGIEEMCRDAWNWQISLSE